MPDARTAIAWPGFVSHTELFMKRIDQDRQGAAKKLALHRETLRRLEPATLQDVQGGHRREVISRPRPTTDP